MDRENATAPRRRSAPLSLTARAYINPRAGGLRHRDPDGLVQGLEAALVAGGDRLERSIVDTAVELDDTTE